MLLQKKKIFNDAFTIYETYVANQMSIVINVSSVFQLQSKFPPIQFLN